MAKKVMRILLVDDDPVTYEFVRHVLTNSSETLDFKLETSGTLADGLSRDIQKNFDVIE